MNNYSFFVSKPIKFVTVTFICRNVWGLFWQEHVSLSLILGGSIVPAPNVLLELLSLMGRFTVISATCLGPLCQGKI